MCQYYIITMYYFLLYKLFRKQNYRECPNLINQQKLFLYVSEKKNNNDQ